MLKQALILWKSERKKGTTLHRRLVFFFVCISMLLILLFTFLLCLFGITGKEEKMIRSFIDNELTAIHETLSDDFSQLTVDGIYLAEEIAGQCDVFFHENRIEPSRLQEYPELLDDLLAKSFDALLTTVNSRSCGGGFILLDATVNPQLSGSNYNKAGLFIKKTQPIYTRAVEGVVHCLRGPAQLARDHGVGLIAQWKMEYDIHGEEFFTEIMNVARMHDTLPLSRLYYWSGRCTLYDNSESGFLLCVPLRSKSGAVFGVCGLEVSDRMFKALYSPKPGIYDNIFAVAAPSGEHGILSSQGMIAGNYYLTGNRLNDDLKKERTDDEFDIYTVNGNSYGGKSKILNLYPEDSPFCSQTWEIAILMPEKLLTKAITGDLPYFIYTVIALLVLSFVASVLISRCYLNPVTKALYSIRTSSYEDGKSTQFLEISDLIEFLECKDKEYEEKIQKLDQEKKGIQSSYDMAQTYITHLSEEQMPNVDRERFDVFLECVDTLTPKENEIFELYLAGKSAKAIIEKLGISQNTLKYHNKNIYSKLGVNSRKQLLEYAALMKIKQ